MLNKNQLEAIKHHSECMKIALEVSFLSKAKYRATEDPKRESEASLQNTYISQQKEECRGYQKVATGKERQVCDYCSFNPFNEEYNEHRIYK